MAASNDVIITGFGCTGYQPFVTGQTPNVAGRLCVVIEGGSDRVDILSVGGFARQFASPPNNNGPFAVYCPIQIFRMASTPTVVIPTLAGNQFNTAVSAYSGVELLWENCITGPQIIIQFAAPASGIPLGCAPPGSDNHWTFQPGAIHAFSGQRLIVVVGTCTAFSQPGGNFTAALDAFKSLSVTGIDYGSINRSSRGGNLGRSVPRSF